MKMVTRVVGALLLVSAVASSALAARPMAEKEQIPADARLQPMHFGTGTQSVSAACQLGVTGPASWLINYLLPPNDAYYTLIDPSTCASCPGGSVIPTAAHMALSFAYTCPVGAVIGVYGASGSAGCYTPNLANVLVAPTSYTVTPAAAGVYDLSFTLPPATCINGPAFLKIEFMTLGSNCSSSARRPRLVTTDTCNPCESWNYYPGGADDLCDPLVGFPGNPMMWVDADCCAVVPTLPKSWGSLKLQYR
ncbi:MAG: hypothetical protein U0704_00940 [Candidatus Eisenbacteria bacterium]